VISVAVEPKSKGRPRTSSSRAGAPGRGDPTFRVNTDDETGQTLIAGMGELHPRDHRRPSQARSSDVDANVGRRRSPTARRSRSPPRRLQGRFVRQTGGSGQYGDVIINLYPQSRAPATEFEDRIVGGKIPNEYIRAVNAGTDSEATSSPATPSSTQGALIERLVPRGRLERACRSRSRARWQFKEAVQARQPKLLEPVMAVEVTTPRLLGDVIGNLKLARGRVEVDEPDRQRAGRQGDRPAVGDVRVRHRHSLVSQGRATFHNGTSLTTRSAAIDCSHDRRSWRRRLLIR